VIDIKALDEQTHYRIPHDTVVTRKDGKTHREVRDPRHSVEMPTPGGVVTLFFEPPAEDAQEPYGRLSEVRLVPGAEPWRLMPRLPLYLAYARAVLSRKQGNQVAALRALRDAGSGRRGHGDDFYQAVAALYGALVAAGERHPVKALAESQPVTIAAASKWIKRARELGMIDG
jgi:hypothetical protein